MQGRDQLRLAAFLVLGGLLGLGVGAPGWGLFLAALAYIVSLHADLGTMLSWLRKPKAFEPPDKPGVFEDVVLEIDYLRERHKKRKKKLANYLKQFQRATRALPDATVVLDVNDEVRWANGAALRDLGVRWPEDVGQRITNLIRLPRLRAFIEEDHRDQNQTIEIECPTDRDRQLSVLTAPYGDDQRILVARDVTQLHRANQIRSDFVANVSHELRTPITVFRGYLENLLRQSDAAPPHWVPALEQMNLHTERMRNLVEELLLLSSLEADDHVAEPVAVDVPGLITEIHHQARALGDRKHTMFSLEIDGDLRLLGARDELYSAFSNVVFNAVHYTGERGVIRVRWYQNDDGAHFEVEDNGIGVAPEHIPRLTERFYRVDSSRHRTELSGGTGLGLAIVKHVVGRHGGRLHIESTVDVGSTFRISFGADRIATEKAQGIVDRSAG